MGWIDFWWEEIKIWWGEGEWANFWLVVGFPHPPVGKTLYKLCQQVFIYNEHHRHHVPRWPSYCCKIWVLCVSQIYMVYIFTCLFSVCNTIYHEMDMFNKAQWWIKYVSKEYLALNIIKHIHDGGDSTKQAIKVLISLWSPGKKRKEKWLNFNLARLWKLYRKYKYKNIHLHIPT